MIKVRGMHYAYKSCPCEKRVRGITIKSTLPPVVSVTSPVLGSQNPSGLYEIYIRCKSINSMKICITMYIKNYVSPLQYVQFRRILRSISTTSATNQWQKKYRRGERQHDLMHAQATIKRMAGDGYLRVSLRLVWPVAHLNCHRTNYWHKEFS